MSTWFDKYICACALAAMALTAPWESSAKEPLRDAPVVWFERDGADVPRPKPRDPSIRWDYVEDSVVQPRERLTDPTRLVRKVGVLFGGDHIYPAQNVNALDEVPNSTWFSNRIGMFGMTPEAAARGMGSGAGPDRSANWVVVSAKTEGVTPGFNIKDATGAVYVIKFDPRGSLNMTSAAGVISNRILHAAGYNVPDDAVVTFRRDDIVLGEGVKIKMGDGKKRPMTVGDIDAILDNVDRLPDGRWLAISSKFLSGKPLGPFNYIGRRKDDPNDTVNHQDRRELRGLYVLAAWLNHFDTKQHNSLDMFVSEGGRSFVKHYLIDFASTLGAGANGASARYGFEHTVDLTMMIARQFTFGFKEDRWRKRTRDHGYHEVGFLEFEYFHPARFRPLQPNHAFANTTDRDGYWAAKIVASFDDDHLGAIVAQGQYQEPGAAAYVAGVLAANRDKIARYYFDRVTPLDYFRHSEGVIHFDDLGRRYNLYEAGATRYRVRVSAVDEDRKAHKDSRTDWMEIAQLRVSLHDGPAVAVGENAPSRPYPFLALECQVDRGEGWSGSVTAYVSRASGHVVAVDR